MSETILVTGATGRTGGLVVKKLVERHRKVRALVHKEDERSKALHSLGVEVVAGDMGLLSDVRRAMQGASTFYFVYPLDPGIVGASVVFAQAAKEAGLELVVNMSQLPARPTAESPASLNHWLGEEAMNWSGVPVAHIRATFFMDWFLWVAPFIQQAGKVIMPWFGDSKVTIVSTEDLARAIAQILIEPQSHVGKTLKLVGSQALSWEYMAQILSQELGKPIGYQQMDADAFAEPIGLGAYFRDHIRETTKTLAKGFFEVPNNLIEEITGSPPLTIAEFFRNNRSAFIAQTK